MRPLVGRLGLAQVAQVLGDVLAALTYAGGRGVVHRDLKPENLLVSDAGGIKVADFGIAKVVGEGALMTYATQTGLVLGTPYYMSPEQARSGEVGPSSDLYATGVIAYELLLLQVPFAKADTPFNILMCHVTEPPPPPATLDPSIDPRLADWLMRMLAKHPGERPPDAATAWRELEEIVTDLLGPYWRREAALPDPRKAVTEGAGRSPAVAFAPSRRPPPAGPPATRRALRPPGLTGGAGPPRPGDAPAARRRVAAGWGPAGASAAGVGGGAGRWPPPLTPWSW